MLLPAPFGSANLTAFTTNKQGALLDAPPCASSVVFCPADRGTAAAMYVATGLLACCCNHRERCAPLAVPHHCTH